MKKYAGAFLSVFILLLIGILLNSTVLIGQASADRIQIFVNDREIHPDVAPQIIQDRVLIPVRFIATALQAEVEWDEDSKTVIITEGSKTIQLPIGKETWLNGRSVAALDVPAQIIEGRTMVPVRLVSEAFYADVKWNPDTNSVHISRTPDQKNSLPVVGSADNLKQLLFQANLTDSVFGYLQNDAKEALSALSGAKGESTQDAVATNQATSDYSRTNVQVAGVDEADVVKTDGTYIYQVNKQRVIIARAFPAENLKVVSRVDFADDKFMPSEIYVDKQHLVVIGQNDMGGPIRIMEDMNTMIYPPIPQRQTLKAVVFNIENKDQPKKVREIELEGNYVSSRKIGDSLYLIANHHIRYYPNQKEPIPLPTYRDTNRQEAFLQVDCADIRYFPDFVRPNLLMIVGLNLASPDDKVQVSTYLGAGDNVYASTENLYVAETSYRQQLSITDKLDAASLKTIIRPIGEQQTQVYRFSLSNGKTVYKGSGNVPGTLLNQFSMDEFNGYFRVATTTGEPWNSGANATKNNLYVLDADLKIVGQVLDIAPGEQIYSVRFMGDRGYMVTFKTVDPLFVVDLKDPKNPKILGALKIPGYSNYLHPYDENHIIGFGKDTVEYARKDTQGRELGRTAYYLGMKIAVFDVSDVQNPIEKFTEKIGDRGTESELLSNHKALYFEKDKNLLAFPVTVMEVQNQKEPSNSYSPPYGTFAFQGAYIYSLDLVNGFKLQKKVTHLNAEDYLKAGDYWYQSDKNVERILSINNTLYTLSKDRIKAHNLSNFEDVAELPLN